MATLYAHTSDGKIFKSNSDWATARDATSGSSFSSTSSGDAFGVRGERTSARGGGVSYNIQRIFMRFDTSGISSNVASATLKIYGYSSNGGDIIVIKATSDISILSTADFDAITGWSVGSADGSGAGDNESNVTKYSSEVTSWSTSGYNDITLTSAALADMRDDNVMYICLMNYDHDLKDIAPTGYSSHRNGLYFADNSGTSKDPYIDYTLAPTDTSNAIFFGCNF